MKTITFEKLLEQYIKITGEEGIREQLGQLRDWLVSYEQRDGAYDVLIEPPKVASQEQVVAS